MEKGILWARLKRRRHFKVEYQFSHMPRPVVIQYCMRYKEASRFVRAMPKFGGHGRVIYDPVERELTI